MKISVIKNRKDGKKSIKNMDVACVFDEIRDVRDKEFISQYQSVCESLETPSQWSQYHRLKEVCPTSEYFRKANGEIAWRQYNGISVLNITELSNQAEIRKAKAFCKLFPQVFCAMEGIDGHSVVVWTLSTLPGGTLPRNEQQAQLFAAKAYAISLQCLSPSCEFDLKVEEPTLDKGCLMNYDPELYVNPNPTPFIIEQPSRQDASHTGKETASQGWMNRLKGGPESYVTLTNIFNAVYSRVMETVSGWKPVDEPLHMINLVADECVRVGLPEEEVVRRLYWIFSRQLTETEVRGTVRNVYANHKGTTRKSALKKHQMVAFRLREFMERRYEIRFNEILQMTEFRERNSLQFLFRELTRRELNTIHHEANVEGIEAAYSEVEELAHSTHVPIFNPIRDFLDNLPHWDGHDHIADLAAMVPNGNPYWTRLFRQWLLSMVAHWMNADQIHANATAPILIGKQGYRKSTFCRMLLPPGLQDFFTDSIDFRSNIEAERSLSRFLLVNIDEFDQLSEKQFAFIKHLFQKPQTNIRRMRSEAIGTQRRYASFIGTSNHQEVLRDPTGNRRYICVEVTAPIRVEEGINHAQLYAQACHLINNGERYWLNDEDETLLRETNQHFESESPLEQIFLSIFTPTTDPDKGMWMRPTEILEEMSHCPFFNSRRDKNLIMLGKVLTKLNIKKERKTSGMAYYVRRIHNA